MELPQAQPNATYSRVIRFHQLKDEVILFQGVDLYQTTVSIRTIFVCVVPVLLWVDKNKAGLINQRPSTETGWKNSSGISQILCVVAETKHLTDAYRFIVYNSGTCATQTFSIHEHSTHGDDLQLKYLNSECLEPLHLKLQRCETKWKVN